MMDGTIKELGLENYAEGFVERLSTGQIKKLVLSNDSTTDYLTKDYSKDMEFFINLSNENQNKT